MSYIKDIKVTDFTITDLKGRQITLGGEITTVLSIDYFESIFEPTIKMVLNLVGLDKVLSSFKLRGTETASIKIEHPSGTLEFDDLFVQKLFQQDSVSTSNIYTVVLANPDLIANSQKKLTQRYEPTVRISDHVDSILNGTIRTNRDYIIEPTANSDGFYGNYWTPFKAIYWLAKRSISTTGSDDGSGTERAGFLFWETKSGYKFRSIDTLAEDAKSGTVLRFDQTEVVDPENNSGDYNVFNPFFERDQDIIDQLHRGLYSDTSAYVNLHSLAEGFANIGQNKNYSDVFRKQTHFGGEKDFVELSYNVTEGESYYTVLPFVDGTMNKDGKIYYNKTGNGEYNPHKVVSQSRMRYLSVLSRSLRITVPYNLELEAGKTIYINLIQSNKGLDKHQSGLYLIKDLRHTFQTTDNGVACYTHLRLIRDGYGANVDSTTNVLSL